MWILIICVIIFLFFCPRPKNFDIFISIFANINKSIDELYFGVGRVNENNIKRQLIKDFIKLIWFITKNILSLQSQTTKSN